MNKILPMIFLFVFIICMASVSSFNNFYAKGALERDTEQILYEFHDTLITAHNVLEQLQIMSNDQCSDKLKGQLERTVFEQPAIRLLGVWKDGDIFCSSAGIRETLEPNSTHRLGGEYTLGMGSHGDKHRDLLLIRNVGNLRYFANLTPFLINHLAEEACRDCLAYLIKIKGEPDVLFSGKKLMQAPHMELNSYRKEGVLDIELRLEATRDFFEYYKEVSLITSITFALLVSSFLTFSAHKLLTVRQSLSRIIKDGIKYSEFVPFYQPIVDSRNGDLLGAEVLVRWQKKDGTVIPPYQFIPYAEESGLIIDITRQLVDKVIKDIKVLGWDKSKKFTSINIVAEHLDNADLFEQISTLLEQENISPKCISLEITERKQIPDLIQARKELEKFYSLGINLKLDDAGTGYGGFSYVQELGIDTLKIDKMFVDTINSDDLKLSVLDAIVAFSVSSGLKTVAEGVENEEQVAYLAERGVYTIQGYFYAKPMPLEDLVKWQMN
ncbi:EAL domain-containing protein [Catenovulum sp. SM1970]|uniref:EAL domain-containing protein n=1 Tax=Marinifaba aquimaris TaxID=2741323 RepID=UPI001572EAE7|nr:EAL domain-containing protein [Marinifaba aquimaris]NTS78361.1 EAL domain-containing protein [Marinifaba aquimaris]